MDRKDDYTNGEIGIILDEFRVYLVEIKDRVGETNGRVKSLELWKQFLLGGWAVIVVVVPLAWYLIDSSINDFKSSLEDQISIVVDNAIEANNDKYFEK